MDQLNKSIHEIMCTNMDMLNCTINATGSKENVTYINNVNNTSEVEMPQPPLYILIIVSMMYIVIFVLGICGNILVIIVICKCKSLHSPTNWLLLNLSIADVSVILVCMPTSLVELFAKDAWYFGQFMC